MNDYRTPRFWLIVAACFSVMIIPELSGDELGTAKGRGLVALQMFFRSLLVEPLGIIGAIAFVMAIGCFAAFLTWPRQPSENR